MIWQSAYLKEELFRRARRLRRRQAVRKWSDRTLAGLEKDVMVGFYSIRKLVEARKVSDDIRDRRVWLTAYSWARNPVTIMNWEDVDRGYDLDHPVKVIKTVTWITNQLIHSFVFMPSFDDEGTLDAIFFNSDHTRRQYLYVIQLDDVITLFEEVGVNDPASMQMSFNPTTYDVRVGPTMELREPNTLPQVS